MELFALGTIRLWEKHNHFLKASRKPNTESESVRAVSQSSWFVNQFLTDDSVEA